MRPIGIVFLKELVDLIRDRRTMISMIVVPVVLMPVLVLGMAFLTARSISKAQQQPAKIMVLGGSNSPVVMKAIRELEMITILPSSQNFTNLISEKKIRAAVQLPDDFDAALERGDPLDVLVYKHEGDMKSGIAARVLQPAEQGYRPAAADGSSIARITDPAV